MLDKDKRKALAIAAQDLAKNAGMPETSAEAFDILLEGIKKERDFLRKLPDILARVHDNKDNWKAYAKELR